MEPFYFGAGDSQRFGVYHRPSTPAADAVVFCYPLGHEYIRAHRACRNLASFLCRAGLAVLRFDYRGTGDSAGETGEYGLDAWQDDVEAAVHEVRRRTGAARVSLIGLRFGATLAALAARRRDDIDRAVFWDPVLDGRSYLDEVAGVQAGWVRDRLGVDSDTVLGDSPALIGLPAPPLLDQIRRVDLLSGAPLRAREVHVVTSVPRPDCEEWQVRLARPDARLRYQCVPSAGDWRNPAAIHQLLLPHEILRSIVGILTGR